jgi:NCAIR mutase (PurE)-related protein
MEKTLRTLLEAIRSGELTLEEGVERLRNLAFEDLGYANVDHHRLLRRGFPEVVLAQGKTPEQVTGIVGRMLAGEGDVLVTRVEDTVAAAVLAAHPGGEHNELGRTLLWRRSDPGKRTPGKVLVISAGTSDIPVAEEAAVTADAFGNEVERLYDVGVAGIHRLLGHGEKLRTASVLIVVAGMEGALASVVGGLTDVPVIAVPTSIGYGASFGGIAALLAMLNSCAAGVTVVNIDNGFGAGYAASLINRMLARRGGAGAGAPGGEGGGSSDAPGGTHP